MKVCDLGIKQKVKSLVQDKPWYDYKEDSDFIEIKASPNGKINKETFIGVARSTANTLNKAINNGNTIGQVFYETFDYNGKVGVIIAPTDIQLKMLNAKEDADRAEILAEEDYRLSSMNAVMNDIEDKIRSGEIKQICEV